MQLNTPTKRIAFLVLILGFVLQGLNLVVYSLNRVTVRWDWYMYYVMDPRSLLRNAMDDAYSGYRLTFWFSAILIGIGISCSFYYESTIGWLINWVKNGQLRSTAHTLGTSHNERLEAPSGPSIDSVPVSVRDVEQEAEQFPSVRREQSGEWVSLPQDKVATHPLYGIKGAAQFLRVVSVVLPGLGLLSAIGSLTNIIDKQGSLLPRDYLLVLPYIVFFLWSGRNAVLLGQKNPSFIPSFLVYLIAGPIISMGTLLVWKANAGNISTDQFFINLLSIAMAWGIWAAIWAPYVIYSKRINVSLLNQIRRNDPFLDGL